MTETALSLAGASCTIWDDGPQWEGRPTATIGKLSIPDAQSGRALIRHACESLAQAGHRAILAPMDGDTWHSYRTVLESDGSPPFLLEPVSGPHDLSVLTGAGFEVLEEYVSARAPVPPPGSNPPAVDGVSIAPWDGEGGSELVSELHAYAAGSFADKLFFKPLDEPSFRVLYEPMIAMLDPRFVLLARADDGELVGFLFGYPDLAQGAEPDQLVLKTYAATKHGVGYLLAWHFHERAREMGFRHVVHALMHSANRSLESSKLFGGAVFRRYGILGRLLDR